MPELEKYAELDAAADYKIYLDTFDDQSSLGLLWLDITSQIVLICAGLFCWLTICIGKCCAKSCWDLCISLSIRTENYDLWSYIQPDGIVYSGLILTSMILEIVAFAEAYPGRLLSPNTSFGIYSVATFAPKYILLLILCFLAFCADLDGDRDNNNNYDDNATHISVTTSKIPWSDEENGTHLTRPDTEKYLGEISFGGFGVKTEVFDVTDRNLGEGEEVNLSKYHQKLVNQQQKHANSTMIDTAKRTSQKTSSIDNKRKALISKNSNSTTNSSLSTNITLSNRDDDTFEMVKKPFTYTYTDDNQENHENNQKTKFRDLKISTHTDTSSHFPPDQTEYAYTSYQQVNLHRVSQESTTLRVERKNFEGYDRRRSSEKTPPVPATRPVRFSNHVEIANSLNSSREGEKDDLMGGATYV